jgi:hypothetical protein
VFSTPSSIVVKMQKIAQMKKRKEGAKGFSWEKWAQVTIL